MASRRRLATRSLLAIALVLAVIGWRPALLEFRLWRARAAIDARDAQLAVDWLQANLRLAPRHAPTHFWLTRAYRHLGQFVAAGRHLRQARDSGYASDALRREYWLLLAQSGQLTQAEPHLRELLIDPGPDGREICEAFVQGYSMNLRLDDAGRLLDVWQADYPDDPQPHFRRGYLAQSLGDSAAAVRHYRRGLELAPRHRDARLRLARVLLELHQLSAAETELRQLAAEVPGDAEVQVSLAGCLLQQGDSDEAGQLLRAVIHNNPDHFEARRRLGEMALEEKNYAEAIRWLEPLRRQRPYEAALVQALAQAHRGNKDQSAADELFAVLRDAERMEGRQAELLEQALSEPSNTQVRFELGQLLLKMGSSEDGARWLRSVLEIDPGHRAAHAALADHYANTGRGHLALEHRQQADAAPP
jgi:tetratricopeptide (TPR) repeat protein